MNTEVKKYRLGNQPEEYELSEKYLGWIPEGFTSWKDFHDKYSLFGCDSRPKVITLVSGDGSEKKNFNLHSWLSKDAFPLHFFGEARAVEWYNFLIVSEQETSEQKFIIPMH